MNDFFYNLTYNLICLKFNLIYRFGRQYKYCLDCLFNHYKLTKVEFRYMRCDKCYEIHSGRKRKR